MRLSYSFKHNIEALLFSEIAGRYYPCAQDQPNYNNNSLFCRFMEIILPYNGECFIPVLGASSTLCYIDTWLTTNTPEHDVKVSYPLYVFGEDYKNTGDAIIQSINRCTSIYRLTKITTKKGEVYYGGQGLIFDSNWNPLIICGYNIRINRAAECKTLIEPICYVSPTVFTNTDLISKNIIKKIIPYLGISGISISHRYGESSSALRQVSIVIKPIDSYFVTPVQPKEIYKFNDSIWNCLEENITDLV